MRWSVSPGTAPQYSDEFGSVPASRPSTLPAATNAATILTVSRVMGKRTAAIYLATVVVSAMAGGLLLGTWLNWRLLALRLRVFSEACGDALTLPEYLQRRFADPRGGLRLLGAAVVLLFFTFYTSSGLVASGKLFEAVFGIEYHVAIVAGALVVVAYTFFGGFLCQTACRFPERWRSSTLWGILPADRRASLHRRHKPLALY